MSSNVLICEDQSFCQMGIELALKASLPSLKKIRKCATGMAAIKAAKDEAPDLALVDLGLPDISGIEVIRSLRAMLPELVIVVVTGADEPNLLQQAVTLKVDGIMRKVSSSEHLKEILDAVAERAGRPETVLDPEVSRLLNSRENVNLTPREYEVLELIVKGRSSRQIAEQLNCGLTTVRFHRANIIDKTNMRNTAELTAWFLMRQR